MVRGLTVDKGIALGLHQADSADELVDGVDCVLGSRKQRSSRVRDRVASFLQGKVLFRSNKAMARH